MTFEFKGRSAMSIEAFNLDEKLVAINQTDINTLKTLIRGKLITPSDDNYNSVRQIWNAMIDRKPAFIVQCSGTADVITAVQFAKKHNLLISVRGGGHNIAGKALQDHTMLIDLSQMRNVHVNPETKTAIVSPGATLADVDHETQAYGLALPTGINSTTGIAGLTLGGGFGWLSRKFGMTIDNLLAVEVVTVEGKRLKCSPQHNADLFWGLTGGSGNFAIVTAFEFKLHSMGPEVMTSLIVFSLDDAKNVLLNYRNFCQTSTEDLSVWTVMRIAPPLPFLDSKYHGKPVLILVGMYAGAIEKGKQWLNKVASLGKPIANATAVQLFKDFQKTFDPLLTPGARNYWKTHNFLNIDDRLIDTAIKYAAKLPGINSEIFLAQMGGVTNRVAKNATAYPHRDVEFIMNVHTRWETSDQDKHCIAWAKDFYQATLPFATGGAYVNFMSVGDESVENAYGENAKRLVKIKTKYDPKNILRTNVNIAPA